jgi:hypothetical protein
MTWKIINDEDSANELLSTFGYFHDSCIKEAHLWTRHWVSKELSMACDELDTSIKFLIQRQFKNPSCIELLFEEVSRINIIPSPKNYFSIIYTAKIGIENNEIFWSIDTDESPKNLDPKLDSWITSKKLKWRVADEFLGEKMQYGKNT